MKKSKLIWVIWNYVEAVILLIAGVLAVVFRENTDLQKVVAYVAGAFVILDGVLRILMVLLGEKESESSIMLVGGFEITLGILLMIEANVFIRLVAEFLYLILIVVGVLFVIFSIFQISKKQEKIFMPIVEMIFAAILIALGIALCILYYRDETNGQITLIIIGCILMVVGLVQIIMTSIILHKQRKSLRNRKPVKVDDEKAKGPKTEKKQDQDSTIVEAEVVQSPKEIEKK